MERGIRRLEIFQDEFDYQVFLEILKKESERRNWEVYEESCWKIRNVL